MSATSDPKNGNETPQDVFQDLTDDEIEQFLRALKPSENEGQYFSPPAEGTSGDTQRAKTSLRLKYEAEVAVIRKKIGTLEEVRGVLGLSRRKICQLLMVDPSSWTRWTKGQELAPPHIYRALQWYMALIEKHPEWHPQNSWYFGGILKQFDGKNSQLSDVEKRLQFKIEQMAEQDAEIKRYFEDSLAQVKTENVVLSSELEKRSQVEVGWKILLLINTIVMTGLLIYVLFK